MSHFRMLAALSLVSLSFNARADWTEARCDIYPRGSDHISKMIPCTFGQRQGAVTITRSDGVTHDLRPVGEEPGNYVDQDGNTAYRQSGLGKLGLIFRLSEESVFVYWDTGALNPPNDPESNATYPFTTTEYDATTLLRCGMVIDREMGTCPAGIMRMEQQQASIVIISPRNQKFTINFMTDYVNSGAGEVEARLEDDTWIVIVGGEERYEVPRAAIEGG
jgi:hypothetical protein